MTDTRSDRGTRRRVSDDDRNHRRQRACCRRTTHARDTNVTDKVMLDFDPSRYDLAKSEMTIPIRIRNVSQDTLYGPFMSVTEAVRWRVHAGRSRATTFSLGAEVRGRVRKTK
jgi:hypothetical protein